MKYINMTIKLIVVLTIQVILMASSHSQIEAFNTIHLDATYPEIEAVAVSHDGNLIAVGAKDVILYDRSTNSFIATLLSEHPYQEIRSLAFSNDDQYLLVGDHESEAAVWSVAAKEKILEVTSYPFTEPFNDIISHEGMLAVAFSIDGTSFYTGDGNGALQKWDLKTGLEVMRYEQRIRVERFDDLGNDVLGIQDRASGYVLIDSLSGNSIKALSTNRTALSPDKSFIVTFAEEDNQIVFKMIDLRTYDETPLHIVLPSTQRGMLNLNVSRNLLIIDGYEANGELKAYNRLFYDLSKSSLIANQPLELGEVKIGEKDPVFSTVFFPNGNEILHSFDRKVELSNVANLKASANSSQLYSR